jgi:hypothetical protein
MSIQIKTLEGSVTGAAVSEAQVAGRPFIIVDLGAGAYIKGVYTRFAVIPAHLVMNRNIQNRAEVVNE